MCVAYTLGASVKNLVDHNFYQLHDKPLSFLEFKALILNLLQYNTGGFYTMPQDH